MTEYGAIGGTLGGRRLDKDDAFEMAAEDANKRSGRLPNLYAYIIVPAGPGISDEYAES